MAKKKTKKQEETEIIIVLDRSGSMSSIGQATVDGFNEFLLEQKGAKGKAFVTLVQFDDRYQVDYKNVPVKNVEDLIYRETFLPRGMTALHDAIGKTILDVDTKRDVVFVIITDGHENASKEFNNEKVLELINGKTTEGWNFIYLGANQDAIKAGQNIGIKAGNSLTYGATLKGTTQAFQSMSYNTSHYRDAKFAMSMEDAKVSLDFAPDQREKADEKK